MHLNQTINSNEKFIRNLRWRAFFYLNPNEKPNKKENYNFKSLAPAPFVKELKELEDGLAKLLNDIKFNHKYSSFQNKLSSGICALCTREKYLIAFEPNGATLNKRSELYSSCRHKEKMLLIKKKRKKRKLPPD